MLERNVLLQTSIHWKTKRHIYPIEIALPLPGIFPLRMSLRYAYMVGRMIPFPSLRVVSGNT
jgi:hypothetical protein